jgi:anti-sigma regulatory factor (Ser/Thr protein kinase)
METLELQLTPTPRAVAEARTAVTRTFSHLPQGVLDDLRLLITELVSNGVLHSGITPRDALQVRVGVDGHHIRGEVIDSGHEKGRVEPRPHDPEKPGGFGLNLVELLSDRWGVKQDGFTCVWFEMHAPGRSIRAA